MIVVMAGVAGSGKTTVGKLLAARLGWAFADADQFHPAANIGKMSAGVPLTDADRGPWLQAIAAWMAQRAAAGESAVVACSALKRRYRELLLSATLQARMVFLTIPPDADEARLSGRHGHFFPERLMASQFAALEMPAPPEPVLVVPAAGTAEQVATEVIRRLGLHAGAGPGEVPGPPA